MAMLMGHWMAGMLEGLKVHLLVALMGWMSVLEMATDLELCLESLMGWSMVTQRAPMIK